MASGIFLMVFYRNVIRALRSIWQQWHGSWSRADLDLGALARSFVIEVLFQRQFFRDSRVRWVRHIYWGFVGLWIIDLVFFFFTKIAKVPDRDPLDLFLDSGLDLYGGILLIGLIVALIRAFFVRGSKDSIYNDTPAVVLFFIGRERFSAEGAAVGRRAQRNCCAAGPAAGITTEDAGRQNRVGGSWLGGALIFREGAGVSMNTTISGSGKAVTIGPSLLTVIIGECINPTGKNHLAAAPAASDLDMVREMALAQVTKQLLGQCHIYLPNGQQHYTKSMQFPDQADQPSLIHDEIG